MGGGRLISLTDSSHLWKDQTTRTTTTTTTIDSVSILVVDDDITCLSIVSALLKKLNYEVVTVKHPDEALCTLRIKGGGAFNLVVSDVHMPDMNGFELQQAIAREFNLPVVLMSADEREGVAVKGLEGGAAFFIMKPVNQDDLRDLWQFAAMKRRENQFVDVLEASEKKSLSENVNVLDEKAVSEASSVKRKSTRKEGSDEKNNGGNSQQKRPKIVWTNSLHNRFLEAIRSIGLDRAVPKKILEVMNVPGLTRENVASHLQKYRIFLRRVSDASYKIQYSSHNGFKSSCESSRITTSPSTLMFNKLSKLAPLSIREASSSSNIDSWRNPSIGNSTLTSHQTDHTRVTHVRNNYSATIFPSLGNVAGGLDVTMSSLPSKNLTCQTNYVGYRISDIKKLTEKYNGPNHWRGMTNLPTTTQLQSGSAVVLNDSTPTYDHTSISSSIPTKSMADQKMQLGFENGGEIEESGLSPIFDMSEFDFLSAQQALDTTFPHQNQQNNGDIASNFYVDMANGDNGFNALYSFHQNPNQLQSSQLTNTQGFSTSSQLNGALPQPNDERNDDEFLESLLAPFGDDQSLEGPN